MIGEGRDWCGRISLYRSSDFGTTPAKSSCASQTHATGFRQVRIEEVTVKKDTVRLCRASVLWSQRYRLSPGIYRVMHTVRYSDLGACINRGSHAPTTSEGTWHLTFHHFAKYHENWREMITIQRQSITRLCDRESNLERLHEISEPDRRRLAAYT